jgi:hypothetical protein
MARRSDPKKLAAWRARLERFSRSELSVAQFCARESVSEASFYHWRKRLGYKGERPHRTERRGVFQPVTVVPIATEAQPTQAPVIRIQLPCGTRIEVRAQDHDTIPVGGVVGSARVGRGQGGDGDAC